MKGKWLIGLVVMGTIFVLARYQGSKVDTPLGPGGALPASAPPGPASASTQAPDPAQSNRPAPFVATRAPSRTTLSSEFERARSYKALYDRLANSSEGQTPDGQFTLYRILRACATVTNRRGPAPTRPSEEERRQYLASLSDTDPTRAKRVAAFESLAEDKCVGLSGITMTEAELSQKLKDAAAAGSPGARVGQIEREMWMEWRGAGSRSPTLSDAQLDTLRGGLASKDPEAIASAGRILGQSFRDLTVRIGPEQANVDSHALRIAGAIAACDYGYPCGESNVRLLEACAYRGHCASGNLPDYINYYEASPNDLQLQAQYRQALQNAIETGDWSAFTFVRGPTVTGPPRPPIRR